MLTINNTFSRRKRYRIYLRLYLLCPYIWRPRPTRPRVPYLMSPRPSPRVPKSQVPTYASQCPRPSFIHSPSACGLCAWTENTRLLCSPDRSSYRRFQSFFPLKIHRSPVSPLARVCKTRKLSCARGMTALSEFLCRDIGAYMNTGSRGDVFVVRTSKTVENLWKMGHFDRVTVSLLIL